MGKSKNKARRYRSLFKYIKNWPAYLTGKITGFGKSFSFDVRGLGKIEVQKNAMGTFRENFLDGIYLLLFPANYFKNENPIVIDVGANIGFFSLNYFSKFPKAQIYGFEPHPFCYEKLTEYKNEFKDFKWEVYNQALSDSEKTITLNTSTVDGYATMSSIFENSGKTQSFDIKAISLGRFIEEQNLESIDLIKMDCEGSEYPILYSLTDQELDKVKAFTIETHLGNDETENTEAVVAFLKNKGYQVNYWDEGDTGYVAAWK